MKARRARAHVFSRLLSCGLFALATAMPLVARADDVATARVRFQEGVALYDKGQYDKARAAFLQAWALKKHPAVLLNLAQSCLKSNHPAEAAHAFQRYLREAPDVTAAQRAEAERGLVEARKKDGRLDIQAAAGAEVAVDDERLGTAPLTEPYDVEPGTHVVRVKGEADQNVTVTAGQVVTVKAGVAAVATPTPPTGPTTSPTSSTVSTTGTPANDGRGVRGESCRARADCQEGLKCVGNTCVDGSDRRGASHDQGWTDETLGEWLGFKLEGVHPFVGGQWLGGPAWLLATTGRGSTNDRNVQGSFLFSLRGGLHIDRHELALELSPFTYIPYNTASIVFAGATLRVAGTYGYLIPLYEAASASVYWPLRIGVGMLAGANNTQGLVYFEGRTDLVGLGVRVGHLFFDVMAPSFRYAFTHRLGTAVHLMSWHCGGNISYVF